MIWNLIRWPLGQLILLIDFLTSPRAPERAAEEQARIDAQTRGMALYQFKACPFCVKTRRAMKRHSYRLTLDEVILSSLRDTAQFLKEQNKIKQLPNLSIAAIPHFLKRQTEMRN